MVATTFVTQTGIEVLHPGAAEARVTGVGAEVASTHAAAVIITSVAIEVLRSNILPPPLDGTPILEWSASELDPSYGESDYDSIFSRGDRVASGLMTVGFYGFASMASATAQSFDGTYGQAGANGAQPTGDTVVPYYGAEQCAIWWNLGAWPAVLTGIEWLGAQTIADDGSSWGIMGGLALGNVFSDSYAYEFDSFPIAQPAAPLDPIYNLKQRVLEWTPRIPIAYQHYEMRFMVSQSYAGSRLSNEFHFKIAHSNLDGGDRRSTNGRPDKRVAFSMSADWSFVAGTNIIDPANALFDGRYALADAPAPVAAKNNALIRAVGGATPFLQGTVGAYLQFDFPRKVRINHILFHIASGNQESYTGPNPNHYGKWHWEVSDGALYVQVGGSWSFKEGCSYMPAPRDPTVGFGLPSDASHLSWRMVLEQGPAFGIDQLLSQIMFNVDDPAQRSLPLAVHMTDDVDGVLPLATIGNPGNPYTVNMSDGTEDAITATVSNVPNPTLSIAMTDGDSDAISEFSDLYPSIIVQTMVIATGRV